MRRNWQVIPLGTNAYNAPGIAAGLVTTNTTSNASLRVPYLGYAPLGLQVWVPPATPNITASKLRCVNDLLTDSRQRQPIHGSRAFNTNFSIDDPNYSVYGLNPAYHPQRLAINYLWNIPLGSHQGLLEKVTSGWSWTGVTVVQDGTPLTVTDTRGGTIYGFGPGAVSSTAEYCAGMGPGNAGFHWQCSTASRRCEWRSRLVQQGRILHHSCNREWNRIRKFWSGHSSGDRVNSTGICP